NVVAAAAPGRRSDYRLDGAVEYRGEETVDLRFRLIDESDATVIWSRSFEKLSGKDDDDVERHLILQLANALVQPFGVIWARDRALDAARKGIELRPQSARAYHMMSAVLFYRREIEASIAAAETAMSLNPFDLLTVCDYGGRLVASGEIDKGMALLLETTGV